MRKRTVSKRVDLGTELDENGFIISTSGSGFLYRRGTKRRCRMDAESTESGRQVTTQLQRYRRVQNLERGEGGGASEPEGESEEEGEESWSGEESCSEYRGSDSSEEEDWEALSEGELRDEIRELNKDVAKRVGAARF